ncbi:MAG TPA: protein-(glutamine-N5) methyltransferase, release factor-specific, partial [Dyella sp.]
MADVRQLLTDAALQLGDRLEAELLLVHVLDKPRSWLIAHADDALDASHATGYAALVERRRHGEPVAYITGR